MLAWALFHQRHTPRAIVISGREAEHLSQKPLIDLIDDLEVPGQVLLDQRDRPLLAHFVANRRDL